MGIFNTRCRGCEVAQAELHQLRISHRDAAEHLERVINSYNEQIQKLTDKVIALSQPYSLRELKRDPAPIPQPTKGIGRMITHFPGFKSDHRPPVNLSKIREEITNGDN